MGAHRLMLLVSSKSQNWIKMQKSRNNLMFWIEHCIWQNFINLNVYKRASGGIERSENSGLWIEYNHHRTLATYIIFYKSKLKLNEKDSILNFLQICIKGEKGGLG